MTIQSRTVQGAISTLHFTCTTFLQSVWTHLCIHNIKCKYRSLQFETCPWSRGFLVAGRTNENWKRKWGDIQIPEHALIHDMATRCLGWSFDSWSSSRRQTILEFNAASLSSLTSSPLRGKSHSPQWNHLYRTSVKYSKTKKETTLTKTDETCNEWRPVTEAQVHWGNGKSSGHLLCSGSPVHGNFYWETWWHSESVFGWSCSSSTRWTPRHWFATRQWPFATSKKAQGCLNCCLRSSVHTGSAQCHCQHHQKTKIVSELNLYLSSGLMLSWWRALGEKMPLLSKVTSVFWLRVCPLKGFFSSSGHILSPRGSWLSIKNVNIFIILHHSLDLREYLEYICI